MLWFNTDNSPFRMADAVEGIRGFPDRIPTCLSFKHFPHESGIEATEDNWTNESTSLGIIIADRDMYRSYRCMVALVESSS